MLKKLVLIILCFSANHIYGQNSMPYLKRAFGSKDSSDYYFGQARKVAKTPVDDADYYFAKNAFCSDNGKEDSAVYYGKIGLLKMAALKDTAKALFIHNNLSKVYQRQARHSKALTHLFAGLKLAKEKKDVKWQGWLLQNIALNYHDIKNYANGIKYAKQAFDVAKKDTADKMSSLLALNTIAINFDDNNKPDSALVYLKAALNYAANIDKLSIGFIYNNIGNSLFKLKKFSDALPYIEQAIVIANQNGGTQNGSANLYEKATSYLNLANVCFELTKYEKATTAFTRAQSLAEASHSAEKRRDLYQLGVKLYKATGNFKEALYYSERYVQLRDSIFKKENAKAIAEVETQYHVADKERLLLLERVASTKKNLWIAGLLMAIVGTAVIAVLIYRQQKLRSKQREREFTLQAALQEVETQNKLHQQRLSISRDLHDNIGAQLTFIISCVDTLNYGKAIVDENTGKQLKQISDFARNTITELRDTLWALHVDTFTMDDLRLRILDFITKAQLAINVNIDFEIDDTVENITLTSLKGVNVYRAMQEAVNNALKHAHANSIYIGVSSLDDNITITVKDNGRGFKTDKPTEGNGLNNMKKRIADIGGTFVISSETDRGTTTTFTVPNNN